MPLNQTKRGMELTHAVVYECVFQLEWWNVFFVFHTLFHGFFGGQHSWCSYPKLDIKPHPHPFVGGRNVSICRVGGFNPIEKYARQIASFPQASGWKLKKGHNHLVVLVLLVQNCAIPRWRSDLQRETMEIAPHTLYTRWTPAIKCGFGVPINGWKSMALTGVFNPHVITPFYNNRHGGPPCIHYRLRPSQKWEPCKVFLDFHAS